MQVKLGLKMAKLIIPRRATGIALYCSFQDFLDVNPDLPKSVEFDFSIMAYIEPACVAFLGNLARWFQNAGTIVTFSGMDTKIQGIKYLDDSLFFEQHLGKKLDSTSKCRSTTLPLKHLSQTDSHAWLEYDFIPWLSDISGLSVTSLAEVRTCIKEVINNISNHTEHDDGCIFSQWYPNLRQIKFSIADFGCGIRETARRQIPTCSDVGAIIWSTQDGTSSKSLPTNRGAGLFLLLQNIVINFNGEVTITSHSGRVRFVKQGNSVYADVITGESYS